MQHAKMAAVQAEHILTIANSDAVNRVVQRSWVQHSPMVSVHSDFWGDFPMGSRRTRPFWSVFGTGLLLEVVSSSRVDAVVVGSWSVPPNAGSRGSSRGHCVVDMQQHELGGMQLGVQRGR